MLNDIARESMRNFKFFATARIRWSGGSPPAHKVPRGHGHQGHQGRGRQHHRAPGGGRWGSRGQGRRGMITHHPPRLPTLSNRSGRMLKKAVIPVPTKSPVRPIFAHTVSFPADAARRTIKAAPPSPLLVKVLRRAAAAVSSTRGEPSSVVTGPAAPKITASTTPPLGLKMLLVKPWRIRTTAAALLILPMLWRMSTTSHHHHFFLIVTTFIEAVRRIIVVIITHRRWPAIVMLHIHKLRGRGWR